MPMHRTWLEKRFFFLTEGRISQRFTRRVIVNVVVGAAASIAGEINGEPPTRVSVRHTRSSIV